MTNLRNNRAPLLKHYMEFREDIEDIKGR